MAEFVFCAIASVFAYLLGALQGWFSAKGVYNMHYLGHHVEWWRGRDDLYDDFMARAKKDGSA